MADKAEENGVELASDTQINNKEASNDIIEAENAGQRSTEGKTRRRGRGRKKDLTLRDDGIASKRDEIRKLANLSLLRRTKMVEPTEEEETLFEKVREEIFKSKGKLQPKSNVSSVQSGEESKYGTLPVATARRVTVPHKHSETVSLPNMKKDT
mmetsp:Transcript_28194/g.45387  ORF Transcript_28194/g.45387 Transcript_28194/m.45387 type:complete len:154 (+) Transcript_28194:72-533(+)